SRRSAPRSGPGSRSCATCGSSCPRSRSGGGPPRVAPSPRMVGRVGAARLAAVSVAVEGEDPVTRAALAAQAGDRQAVEEFVALTYRSVQRFLSLLCPPRDV